MKIVIALNNEFIYNKLNEKYDEKVYKFDISSKENVIEYLSRLEKDEEIILITKDNLEGNLNEKMYIKQLRLACNNIKIIYIVKKLDNEYKEFLFANEVFNIIEGTKITLEELIINIEDDKKVIYKTIENENLAKISEAAIDYNCNNVITKKIIAIYGTSGSGKSYISSLIAKEISKKIGVNVSLLDMDVQNPSIDIYNNLDVNIDGLTSIVDDAQKNYDISQVIDKYMLKDKNNKNLWYMTNNASIFDVQNKFSNKYYNKIYNYMKSKFDICLVDLPASPFLDVVPYTITNADLIYFVVNPNYVSVRQAIKYLQLITNLWNVPKDNIKIILNKTNYNSLSSLQVSSLLGNYEIVMEFKNISNIDSYINGVNNSSDIKCDISNICTSLGIENNKRYKSKFEIFKKIIRN